MALAPADFYAYSRATGVPVPEDPEERAQMAPEVAEFRRNQLKAPQQESNLLQNLGLAALGVGATVGAVLGGRRLMRGAPAQKVTGARGTTLTDLTPELQTAKRYTAASTTPPPSKIVQPEAAVKPSTIDLSNVIPEPTVEEIEGALSAPRQYVYRPKGGIQDVATEPSYADQLITDPNTGEIFRRGKSPESFAQTYVSLRPELTGQKTNLPLERTPGSFLEFSEFASGQSAAQRLLNDPELKQLVAQQKRQEGAELGREAQRQMRIASAIESEADEYLAQLRQESLTSQTLGALESGEDQVTGRVMLGVQRNEDLDSSQINEVARQTGSVDIAASLTPDGAPIDQTEINATRAMSSQELADVAKSEMMALRQQLAEQGLRPGTERFERALAQSWTTKSIPGVAPGTQEFRRLQDLGKVDVSLPTAIRKAVDIVGVGADPTGFVPERTVINIGPYAQVTQTAAGTAIRGASPSYHEALPKIEERQLTGAGDPLLLGVPDEMGPDIGGAARVRGAMSADIPETEMSKQEIQYSFLNKPPAAELPGGSAGIGVYGLEPGYVPGAMSKRSGEYSAAAERQPTYVPGWLQRKEMRGGFEALSTPQLAAAAEKASGRVQQAFQGELQRRQTAKESIAVSEVLRRARIEGRDPQMILRQLGFKR